MEFAVNGSSMQANHTSNSSHMNSSASVRLPLIPTGKKKPSSSSAKTPPNLLAPASVSVSSSQRRPRAHSLTNVAIESTGNAVFPPDILASAAVGGFGGGGGGLLPESESGSSSRRGSVPNVYLSEGNEGLCIPGADAKPMAVAKQPIGMTRAKVWTIDVENAFRFQLAGFRDKEEYEATYGPAEEWEDVPMIKCLRSKKTGFFLYFRKSRECEDKHLNKIKLYQYA